MTGPVRLEEQVEDEAGDSGHDHHRDQEEDGQNAATEELLEKEEREPEAEEELDPRRGHRDHERPQHGREEAGGREAVPVVGEPRPVLVRPVPLGAGRGRPGRHADVDLHHDREEHEQTGAARPRAGSSCARCAGDGCPSGSAPPAEGTPSAGVVVSFAISMRRKAPPGRGRGEPTESGPRPCPWRSRPSSASPPSKRATP